MNNTIMMILILSILLPVALLAESVDHAESDSFCASETFPAVEEALRLRTMGDLASAIEILEPIAESCPNLFTARIELAVTRSWDGQLKRALDDYEAVLHRQPTHETALLGWARIQSWLGNTEDSSPVYASLLRDNPEHVEALNGMALVYRIHGNYRQASKMYSVVLRKAPDNREARDGLAAIEKVTRIEGSMSLGHAAVQNGEPVVGNRLGLVWRNGNRLTVAGSFLSERHNQATGANRSIWTAEIGYRINQRTSASLGFDQTLFGFRRISAASLSASHKVGKKTTFVLGIKPGLSSETGFQMLVSPGAIVTISGRGYALVQYFHFRSARGAHTNTFAVSGSAQFTKLLEVKPSVSMTRFDGETLVQVAGSVMLRAREGLRFGVQIGRTMGVHSQANLGVSATFSR